MPNISLQLARYELPLEAQSVMPLVCFQYATVAEHNHQLFTSEQLPVGCSSNHRQAAWTPNSCLICKCFHHDIICLKAYLQSNFIEDHINIATSSSSSSNNLLTPSLIYSWSVLAFLGWSLDWSVAGGLPVLKSRSRLLMYRNPSIWITFFCPCLFGPTISGS